MREVGGENREKGYLPLVDRPPLDREETDVVHGKWQCVKARGNPWASQAEVFNFNWAC